MRVKIEDIQIAELEPVMGHPDPAGEPGEEGVNRAQLVKRLRELAEVDPPVCHHDEPEEITVFGQKITVYCKPFEQFQFLLRMAADTIEAEPVRHGRWENIGGDEWCCTNCGYVDSTDGRWEPMETNYCPNCGAKMDAADANAGNE